MSCYLTYIKRQHLLLCTRVQKNAKYICLKSPSVLSKPCLSVLSIHGKILFAAASFSRPNMYQACFSSLPIASPSCLIFAHSSPANCGYKALSLWSYRSGSLRDGFGLCTGLSDLRERVEVAGVRFWGGDASYELCWLARAATRWLLSSRRSDRAATWFACCSARAVNCSCCRARVSSSHWGGAGSWST